MKDQYSAIELELGSARGDSEKALKAIPLHHQPVIHIIDLVTLNINTWS